MIFMKHPLPWKYVQKLTQGENGGDIAGIVDADGGVIATSYWSYTVLDVLWALYNKLTPEQEEELGGSRRIVISNTNQSQEDSKMPTVEAKHGFYPCDYQTFKKLKRLNFLLLASLKRIAENRRWHAKAPQNRVWRHRPYRGAKREIIGPRLVPVLSPLSHLTVEDYEEIRRNYNYARYPAAGPEGVNGISITYFLLVDSWLKEAEAWFAEHGKIQPPVSNS